MTKTEGPPTERTQYRPSEWAHWWKSTDFYNLKCRVETVWWKAIPLHPDFRESALTCVMWDDAAAVEWAKDYPLPVTIGGLDEAHEYVCQQVREDKITPSSGR